MKTVFMGTPEIAVPALEALLEAGHEVLGIYTRPDRPAGRGRWRTASPATEHALDRGLPGFQLVSLVTDAAPRELAQVRVHRVGGGFRARGASAGPVEQPRGDPETAVYGGQPCSRSATGSSPSARSVLAGKRGVTRYRFQNRPCEPA